MATTETRLAEVEDQLEAMSARMRRLELEAGVGEVTPREPARPAPLFEPEPGSTPPSWAEEDRRAGERAAVSFEEVFGGRVLAWVGGLAILIGAVLFLGMAISRGWLDETARAAIAATGSLALLLAGLWLEERKGKAEAARAAVASGISGLFATLVVATQAYELITPAMGLLLAALVAAAGLVLAVRWSSPVIAAVGSLGALAAPVLVGADLSGRTIEFVAIALAAIVGILVWQRWDWLALGAFAASAPQLIAWSLPDTLGFRSEVEGPHEFVIPMLLLFWALYLSAAFGYELRERWQERIPVASWLLLFCSSALVVGLGYHLLASGGSETAAVAWLFAIAAIHLALGALALRLEVQREIGSLLLGTGLALVAFGFAEALDGPALVIVWAAVGAALAWLATRADADPDPALSDAERLLVAAGSFLGLAATHTLAVEAPPSALFAGVEDLGAAAAAIAACAIAAAAVARCARRISPDGATAAGLAAAASLVYLGSVAIVDTVGVDTAGEAVQSGQVWLSVFWTVTGLGAVVWGLARRSAGVRLGGLALLAAAIVKVWTYDLAELEELARVLSFLGLGLLLLVGAYAYQRIKPGGGEERGDGEQRQPRAGV